MEMREHNFSQFYPQNMRFP